MNVNKLNHLLLISMLILFSSTSNAASSLIKTEKDKLSYTIGADIGENFRKQNINIDVKVLLQGLNDAINEKKLLMSTEQMEHTLQNFQKGMIKKKAEEFKGISQKNKKEGENFLKANKGKKGIKTTKSGLQYKVITQGKGRLPSTKDTVTVNYKGTLLDGTVFDSTEKTGKPVSFKLTEVIKGWTEILQKMKPGARCKVFIPPELAYGERGVGGPIGPNATLIFDIHLVSIKSK